MRNLSYLLFFVILFTSSSLRAASYRTFKFEDVVSIEKMTNLISKRFSLKSSREELRKVFVSQGNATLKKHPSQKGVEKYLYDINLCSIYIWRWNISADYDQQGQLLQAYINGNPVFPNGTPKRIIPAKAEAGKKATISKRWKPRPEAYKGEKSIAYLLFDRDSNSKTTEDQALMGAGPSRADPHNMGNMFAYSEVDPWRSIFDRDNPRFIAPYKGSCSSI